MWKTVHCVDPFDYITCHFVYICHVVLQNKKTILINTEILNPTKCYYLLGVKCVLVHTVHLVHLCERRKCGSLDDY